jgi:tetratricopeptide (TPR) repeat protein
MRAAESLEEMKAVARDWEALLQRHPSFIHAYAPLIRLYNTDYGYTGLGSTSQTERARAYSLARKAARLDSAEAYLQTVSAWCHLWAGEAASARDHLKQALELNPFQRDRLLEVATALMFLGDLDQAAELLAKCETLTPFATGAPHEETGLLHLLLGHYDTALECLDRLSQPTVSSELYALLAAGASEAKDFQSRVEAWTEQARRRWRSAVTPDVDTLGRWVLYHHPFQAAEQRVWVLELLRPAFSKALAAPARILAQALPAGSSAPSLGAASSSISHSSQH